MADASTLSAPSARGVGGVGRARKGQHSCRDYRGRVPPPAATIGGGGGGKGGMECRHRCRRDANRVRDCWSHQHGCHKSDIVTAAPATATGGTAAAGAGGGGGPGGDQITSSHGKGSGRSPPVIKGANGACKVGRCPGDEPWDTHTRAIISKPTARK